MIANARGYAREVGNSRWRWSLPSGRVVTVQGQPRLTEDQLEGLWGVYEWLKRRGRGSFRSIHPGDAVPIVKRSTMLFLGLDRRIVGKPVVDA